ncbi:sensor histidine kinase [Vreelandella alkaliphila]|uniref:histidine kinase n=1 Tax=Vreelandella alkaliphila TaxID=272774 RepID=A0A7C9P038_9GAMM|nr:PAS domain-containing sensor histidine kinase [Halomonas alkaliphila]NDL69053.1 two-component sensor histidine kinase [Halomonas alkaliphila]
MIRLPSRARVYWLPLVAIGLFVILLFFSLMRLGEVEKTMRSHVDENMLWVIAQAQLASHRLQEAVHRHAMNDPDAQPEQRLDVLYSRLTLMDQGPQRRYIRALGFEPLLDDTLEQLAQIDSLLPLFLLDELTSDDMYRNIQPLLTTLNRMANAVMMAEWESTGQRLDDYRDSLMQVIYSAVGILVTGLLLALLLLWALSKRRQAQEALTQHLDHLEDVVSARTQDLEEQRRRLADSINTAPDGFAAFSANGQLQLINSRLAQLLPETERIFSPSTPLPDVVTRLCQTCVSTSATLPLHQASSQCDIELAGGEWRQLTLRRTPSGGHVMRLADITPYKKAAIALENALERERGVSDFYRSFAAMVSHQFRTSLAVIDSGLQRLMRHPTGYTTEERKARYQRLRDTATHMTELVDASLLTAQLDAGQVRSYQQPHDLIQLARKACHLHQETSDNDRLPINLVLPPALKTLQVSCDKALTEHIIDNLLTNARKYSRSGHPINIELSHDAHWAYCRVSNQGDAIPSAEQPHIFERFYRGANGADQQGLGLGLNIARTLARIQQGELVLLSSTPEATTFQLTLPQAQTQSDTRCNKESIC